MEQQKGLKHGLYKIFWMDGGSSLASIGFTYDGTNWFSCCNWTSKGNDEPMVASTKWQIVKSIELIMENNYDQEYRQPCSLCKTLTKDTFNIKSSKVPVCEECAKEIFIEQSKYYYESL